MSFLNPLYNALGYVLAFFYSLVPNLGVAIIFATIATMLALYPLTAKQTKSMITMQRVQPEVKKLQAKYKGDRQKMNEEVMKFYQENKINPLAGCLPLLVQLPIFYVLFRVLRTPYQHVPKTGSFNQLYTAMCGQWGHLCGKATTHAQTVTTSTGAQRVVHAGTASMHLTHLSFLGIDLTKSATDASLGFGGALPYYILVALVMLTGYLQTRQAASRTPAASKQMGTMMKILPIFFGVISLTFPAGLVLYFFVSNTWRLGQQELIFRKMANAPAGPPPKAGAKGDAIDVASTERANEAKAQAAAAAALEEPEEPDEPEPPAAPSRARPGRGGPPAKPAASPPEPPAPRSRARSANPPTRRAAAPSAPVLQEARGGGFRSYFQLPPPPRGNGGSRPNGPSRTGNGGAAAAPRNGPGTPPPRPSRSKKKRKR